MPDDYRTERSTVKRIAKRGAYDRNTIHKILDEGLICHVGFTVDGQTFVIPTIYVRVDETICVHGSAASRMLKALSAGVEACITVTLVDGLVLARSAFHHSMNYRSVVVFGSGHEIEDPADKNEILRKLSDHLIPGRWDDVRVPSASELKQTMVVAIPIREGSAKIRIGPPLDDEVDYDLPVWAGVVPLKMTALSPVDDARLTEGISLPVYASRYNPASTMRRM